MRYRLMFPWAAACLLVGCAADQQVNAAGPDAATVSEQGPPALPPDGQVVAGSKQQEVEDWSNAPGFESWRKRVAVATVEGSGEPTIGYVDRDLMVPDAKGQYPAWADVYNAETAGHVIAKWGYVAGWIALDEAAAPGFDLAAVKAQAMAEAAKAHDAGVAARQALQPATQGEIGARSG